MSEIGSLRENDGYLEVFNGDGWMQIGPLNGTSFRHGAVMLSAPLDATPKEVTRWVRQEAAGEPEDPPASQS